MMRTDRCEIKEAAPPYERAHRQPVRHTSPKRAVRPSSCSELGQVAWWARTSNAPLHTVTVPLCAPPLYQGLPTVYREFDINY